MPALLVLLSFVNLVIGTGAFVIGGILASVASDLGVSVAAAGQAMTVYALASGTLAPLVLVATGRWSRKHALLAALAVYVVGNAVSATATSLTWLLVGRALMGLGAVFTPIAAGIAVASVDAAKRGRALSIVFLGMSLSYALGVPLGAWLGLKYGWQVPIQWLTLAGVLTWVVLALRVPGDIKAPGASFTGLGALLARHDARRMLLLTLCYFTSIFCVFSYSGPVLQALHPMSSAKLSFTLMLFGVAGVAGTLIGGWANDRFGSETTLRAQLSILALMMVLVPLTAGTTTLHHAAMVLAFIVWGTAGFGMMAPQQSRLAALSPAQAPLLMSLNTSMLYAGTAVGAAAGGLLLPHTGYQRLSWVGLPFALLGLWTLRRRAVQPTAAKPTSIKA